MFIFCMEQILAYQTHSRVNTKREESVFTISQKKRGKKSQSGSMCGVNVFVCIVVYCGLDSQFFVRPLNFHLNP